MALDLYDGSDEFFDIFGKLAYAAKSIDDGGDNARTRLLAVVTAFEAAPNDLAVNAIIADANRASTGYESASGSAMGLIRTICRNYLVQLVSNDTDAPGVTLSDALDELIEQMGEQAVTVQRNSTSYSQSFTGDGNGVLVVSLKRGDGLTNELAFTEAITLIATDDAGRTMRATGTASVDVLSPRWPQGSGASTTLTVSTASTSRIQYGDFEEASTSDEHIPKGWILTTGQPGVTIGLTSNEEQTIAIAGTPTGGYYLLSYTDASGKVQTTDQIAYNAAASTVQSALRKLAGLSKVTVTATGTTPNFTHTVTFTGVGGNVALLAAINHMTGATSVNEQQRIALSNTDGGTFTISFNGSTTAAIDYDATSSEIDAALEALGNIASGDLTCAGGPLPGSAVTVTFGGTLAGANQPAMTLNTGSLTRTAPSVTVTTTTSGALGTNEVQSIASAYTPNGGTWTITWNGQTTGNIAHNANAATVQAALIALSNIGSGDVTVSGGPLGTASFVITFSGALAGANLPELTVNESSLLGPDVTVSVSQITEGSPSQNEEQEFSLYGSPSGGTFTLTYGGQTTSGIAYNADAATVQAALEALSNIGSGDVAVTGGALPGASVAVEFTGALAATNLAEMTINTTNLTGGSISAAVSTTTQGSLDLNVDLQSYWKLDEASGTRYDSVGANDLSGTNNPLSTTGKVSDAALLASGSKYLRSTASSLELSSGRPAITVAFWLKMSANPSSPQTVLGQIGWNVLVNGTTLAFRANNNTKTVQLSATVTPTNWTHVAFYIDLDNEIIGLSIDGATWSTTALTFTPNGWGRTSSRFTLGADYFGVGGSQAVIIDECGFWDRVLSATELVSLYNSGAGSTYPFATGANEVQRLTVNGSPSQGSFTLTYDGQTTSALAYNANAAAVQAALIALSNIGASDVACTGGALPGTPVDIEFTGTLANTNVSAITVNDNFLKHSISTTTQGNPGTNEAQRISASPAPVAGTFTLTYDGQTTSPLDYDATAAEIDAALEALSNIGAGDVTCTGGPINASPVLVTFSGLLAATNVVAISATSSLTGQPPTDVTVTTTTQGAIGTNEVQTVTLGHSPNAGTFTLSHSSVTSGAIPYDASASALQTILNAMSIATFTVTGPAGGPWAVTFGGSLAAQDVALFTANASGLSNAQPSGTVTTLTNGSPDSGSITITESVAGDAEVYAGGRAMWFEGDGSELTTLHYKLTLNAATSYAINCWMRLNATDATGVIKFELVDGVSGSVIQDDQSTNNALTVNVADLTTSFQALTELVTEPVFRTPTKLPPLVYLRVRFSTAPSSGTRAFFDELALVAMTELYAGGPFATLFGGADAFRVGDQFTLTVSNDYGGDVHQWANRMYGLGASRQLLKSASSLPTVPDSVIG